MHQEHPEKQLNSSPAPSHHPSTSTYSTSPILHSTSSLSAEDDNYQLANETDDIILRGGYYPAIYRSEEERNSLWHDLDRDGVNTPPIPSFILNSPPIAHLNRDDSVEVTIHSLRKGIILFLKVGLITGCDPKSFFGENVEGGNLNTETCTPHVDMTELQYPGRRCNKSDPSFTENPIWATNCDIAAHKCSPEQGPLGIIPSRSVMISNLPKTTQLWTLVELLKVLSFHLLFGIDK